MRRYEYDLHGVACAWDRRFLMLALRYVTDFFAWTSLLVFPHAHLTRATKIARFGWRERAPMRSWDVNDTLFKQRDDDDDDDG